MISIPPDYTDCRLCGRQCGIDRRKTASFCGEKDRLRLAWGGLHFGEEPPLVGEGGSGTVFFTGCTLGCPFCQNHQISRGGMGREVDDREFLRLAGILKDAGAVNLNLVTPSHFIPTLARLLPQVGALGLPVVWNSSGQEESFALEAVFPHVDIFLPDMKTLDPRVAERYYKFASYPDIAASAVLEMVRRRPLALDGEGVMKQGVLLRHLVLPGEISSTEEVFRWFRDHLKGKALLSVMSQYTPVSSPDYPQPDPSRFLSREEYDQVLELLFRYDLEDGFIQEWITGSDWLPDFRQTNPFSSELSRPYWHWDKGFL